MRLLLAPFAFVLRLLGRPLALWARARAAGPSGWVELELEGELRELPPPRAPFLRRLLRARGDDGPRVVLSELERLTRELASDPRAKGLLVRLGPLGAGWARAARVRALLERLTAADKKVLVHLGSVAGNKEYLVATAGTQISAAPSGIVAAVGTASQTVFLGEALERLGVRIEVAAAGRYKSAPEAFTRKERSEPDREQATALVRAIDGALLAAVRAGRKLDAETAKAQLDRMPLTGARAKEAGLADALAHDDELPELVARVGGLEEPAELVPAGAYLDERVLAPLIRRRRKVVGVVEVHGAIMDRATPLSGLMDGGAVTKAVVNDLRAALADKRVGAVVLHVDSRGGSVLASDDICAAVRRLDRDKPVIACFGDVAASGGYYVACGARAIVASPLTVTGSIGVFGMMPTWPTLAARLGLHADVIAERLHAAMADPFREHTAEERAHAQAEVESMYRAFLELVAAARKRSVDEIHALAEGRVWIGEEAHARGLLDGLGGLEEAIDRAKAAAGARFAEEPRVIRARKPQPRPEPAQLPKALLGALGVPPLLLEALALQAASPEALAFAWSPVEARGAR